MNYIVISPYYPQNFQQFTIELANKGITVLGIGQEPYEFQLFQEPWSKQKKILIKL